MTKHTSMIFELLAKGRLSEIEKIFINHPHLREILLHWKGIRKTAFFKNRIHFYKNYARQCDITHFTPEVKNTMRDEFAKRHCLRQTLQDVIDSYDIAAFTTKISRIRFNQMLKKKRQQRHARLF